jgi:hypothetical protein
MTDHAALPATAQRVPRHSAEAANERIAAATLASVHRHAAQPSGLDAALRAARR